METRRITEELSVLCQAIFRQQPEKLAQVLSELGTFRVPLDFSTEISYRRMSVEYAESERNPFELQITLKIGKEIPLIVFAAAYGAFDVVRALALAGENVNAVSSKNLTGYLEQCRFGNERTVLMYAASEGLADIVKMLLDRGAAVNAKESDGCTALMYAAQRGFADVVKILLNHGAEVNFATQYGHTALMDAARSGAVETVKMLLDHGAEVNAVAQDGYTALMRAARCGSAQTVRILLKHGAGTEAKEKDHGYTALMCTESPRVVKDLLMAGANVNYCTKSGDSPLMKFARDGNMQAVELVLANGANIHRDGGVALADAVMEGRLHIAERLLKEGVGVNDKSESGKTALMWAVQNELADMIEILLSRGADVNAQSNDGWSPLHYAIGWKKQNKKILDILLAQKGIDIDLVNYIGDTALIRAARSGNLIAINALLAAGADASIKNKRGQTALDMARSCNRAEAAEILASAGAAE